MNKPASSTEQSVAAQHWAALGIGHHTLRDSELLELYSYSRSSAVLSEIVRRHSPLVASVIRRLISNAQDGEDAFQATFLVLVLSVNKIRNPDSLSAWLYGVAFRTAKRMRSMRRKNNIRVALQSTLGIDLDAAQSPVEEPLAIIARELQLEALDEELSRLPKHLRDPLVEHYLGGNTVPEIARCLNLSVTAVEGRLKRGRKALRTRLAMRGVSLTIVAAACIRFQQDAVAASAEPWASRFIELVGNVGVGHPTLAKFQETTTVSSQLIQLVQGELVMKLFSRSIVGVGGGILVLGALGTIGFVSALANQQPSPSANRNSQSQIRTQGLAPVEETETFVLAQGMGGMDGGGMMGTGRGPDAAKEIVIKWEKPTGPVPAWLSTKSASSEREDAIRAKLNDRLSIDLNGSPLSDAMANMSKQMDIPIIIDDKALEEENITPDEPITIKLPLVSFRSALKLILEPLQLTYVIEDEVMRVTSKKTSANACRFYDLSSILPDNGLTTELCSGIETMISPDQWQSAGGSSNMTTVGSMLVIVAPHETHTAIEWFLQEVSKQPSANLKPRVFVEKPASKPGESEKPAAPVKGGGMGGMM